MNRESLLSQIKMFKDVADTMEIKLNDNHNYKNYDYKNEIDKIYSRKGAKLRKVRQVFI